MTSTLAQLASAGVLSRFDEHLGKALARLVPGTPEEVVVAVALASRAVREGHVCADLAALTSAPPRPAEDAGPETVPVELPSLAAWTELLLASPLVSVVEPGSLAEPRPLVLAAGRRLYLHRYHRYESELATCLAERATSEVAVDAATLADSTKRLFRESLAEHGEQWLGGVVAALRRLTVLSGGPGTGKTHTVARLLAVLLEHERQVTGRSLRIELLAPTGKAAQRLGESIRGNLAGLECDDEIRARIPSEASTIHRALGFLPGAPTRFRHDRENPLPADVVLVDEASMVDVALMSKLVDAVPRTARLILVGDKDQLASVEAGAILGDILGETGDPAERAARRGASKAFADRVESIVGERVVSGPRAAQPGIRDCRVHLTVSRRYGSESGIARVAHALNAGDARLALEALRGHADVAFRPIPEDGALDTVLRDAVLSAFGGLSSGSPEERLRVLDRLRILCVHRNGPLGVASVNALIERLLREGGALPDEREWYDGRPILVTENDHQLELYNGDVGVLARGPSDTGRVDAWFPGRSGVRAFAPARLPPHETVFAMTVHKSQGSEFDRVVLLLPARPSPVLTRELLYTAVTRARTRVEIIGGEDVLMAGVGARVERHSGLSDALWT